MNTSQQIGQIIVPSMGEMGIKSWTENEYYSKINWKISSVNTDKNVEYEISLKKISKLVTNKEREK